MQRRATKLPLVADQPPDQQQLSFIPARKPSRPVSLDHLPILKSTTKALIYSCELADRCAKDIYPDMEYDPTKWSRICSGERDLIGREIPKFNKVVGNSAYLLYLNYLDGWDLSYMRKAPDDKDRKIAELEQKVADQDRAIRLMVEYHRGGRTG